MNFRYTLIAILVFAMHCSITSTVTAQIAKEAQAEGAQEEEQTPEQKVEQAFRAFHEGVRSDDEETRLAALDKMNPQRADVVLVLGEEMTEKIWEDMARRIAGMRENSAEVKEQFDSGGDLVWVEVSDIRKDEDYAEDVSIVPERFPVFSIVAKTESGGGGSSTYVIIDDRVVFMRDLDMLKSYLEHLEKEDKE